MRLLENLTTDKRKVLVVATLILAAAAFLRFYNIDWSFSNNGVDEGIMLERARMVSAGYAIYAELPCDQAPLAFLVGSFLDGDVFGLRVLTASLSMVAIAACMIASKKQQGNAAMLVTGVLLAIDFALLRESRLFSLDGLSTFSLAIALPFYLHYIRKDSRLALFLAGLLVGISAATKLFGALALVAMLLFMVVEYLRPSSHRSKTSKVLIDGVVLVVGAALPIVRLLLALGPTDMLNGMVFDQGHRQFDLVMKLSIPIFFGLSLAYALPLVYAKRTWSYSKEARFLLVLTGVLFVNFVLQPLVFLHHMVVMSPGLAILSGMFVARELENKKGLSTDKEGAVSPKKRLSEIRAIIAVTMVGVLVSAGLASYGIAAQQKPGQMEYAEKIAQWTTTDDYVISGDPLITAYAERLTPPSMVNVGTRIYPELTLVDVESAVMEFDVAIFLVSYRFLENDMNGLVQFLESQGYEQVSRAFMGEWHVSAFSAFEEAGAPMVFVRGDIVVEFGLPTEDTVPRLLTSARARA